MCIRDSLCGDVGEAGEQAIAVPYQTHLDPAQLRPAMQITQVADPGCPALAQAVQRLLPDGTILDMKELAVVEVKACLLYTSRCV